MPSGSSTPTEIPSELTVPGDHFLGRTLSALLRLGAFALIVAGTAASKFGRSSRVIYPRVMIEIHRSGVRLLPIVCFLGLSLGVVFVGQTVALLGNSNLTGVLLVTVVIRELSPLVAALVVLARVGTAAVIDLGTARALGEVEALEALGIDPIHYLVVPRVVGFTVSVFGLTVYLALLALAGGYAFGYARGVPLALSEFFGQVTRALSWMDFPLLAAKTLAFGAVIGLVVCYHGLARPLRLEEVGQATTRTVAQCVVGCLVIDAVFILLYLAV
jgi:phospholipid/cholesterol/gamma-HCH transport system permease protein